MSGVGHLRIGTGRRPRLGEAVPGGGWRIVENQPLGITQAERHIRAETEPLPPPQELTDEFENFKREYRRQHHGGLPAEGVRSDADLEVVNRVPSDQTIYQRWFHQPKVPHVNTPQRATAEPTEDAYSSTELARRREQRERENPPELVWHQASTRQPTETPLRRMNRNVRERIYRARQRRSQRPDNNQSI